VKVKLSRIGRGLEDAFVGLALSLLAVLPIMEIAARKFFRTGLLNSSVYIQHLVLAAAFMAAAVASRERKHLSMAIELPLGESLKSIIRIFVGVLCASITLAFAMTAFSFALQAFGPAEKIGPFPKRLVAMVMFLGFALMGIRFITGLGRKRLRGLWLGLAALLAAFFSFGSIIQVLGSLRSSWLPFLTGAGNRLQPILGQIAPSLVVVLIASAFLGSPVFVVLGGIGYFLFAHGGQPLEVVPNQAYSVLTGHSIPAIPLFVVVGFILSESRAGERLVKFFQAVFSWVPGGLTMVAVLVCAFFTTFTGASGVTIVALGGLLSYILINGGYPRKFTVGLLTSSGSIGLLFPPSLPVIIYGVTAGVSIKDMFVGGLIPGGVLVLTMVLIGIIFSLRTGVQRHPFQFKEAASAFGKSIWELLLPMLIAFLYFGGIANLMESAAFAMLYAWIVETFIKRDLSVRAGYRVLNKCVPVIGGVLIILALANGLSYYIIDAQIPAKLAAWIESAISSKYVFLLLLNLALLVVGCFMDIYSAILVVVPLIIPLGNLFHVHPVHLGIIFLANLELGYLTPPVGLNLFLASYRFEEPMPRVYRDVFLFICVQIVTLLLITYLPFLTTALLR
jgi:tripartite ATP-independent transporter DctM subunit